MAIESPCAETCKFDRKADLCVGCFHTTDEIRVAEVHRPQAPRDPG
jgi:predicted Fe-S protein YdhL (DUF1289 family)